MSYQRAGQLARYDAVARPGDSLGLVAENLRASHYGAIPILDADEGRFLDVLPDGILKKRPKVIGLVEEHDLSKAVLDGKPATELMAQDVMRTDVGVIPEVWALENVLITLDRYNASALPVVDGAGGYRGMISRSDVVSAMGGAVRPPVIGGMATPLGVWLTNGNQEAGAPPLGLFLSGVTLALCFYASRLVMMVLLSLYSSDMAAAFQSGRLGSVEAPGNALNLIFTVVHGLIFLLCMRALPISGVHAAEHQTVWAIERGVPLTPENVARMPRAHPRCGTNLMALTGLIIIIFQHLPDFSPFSVLISLLVVYLFWRNLGEALQVLFTTRVASREQLESGIKAGKDLLAQYQKSPGIPPPAIFRLLHRGMLLTASGMICTTFLLNYLEAVFAQLAFPLR